MSWNGNSITFKNEPHDIEYLRAKYEVNVRLYTAYTVNLLERCICICSTIKISPWRRHLKRYSASINSLLQPMQCVQKCQKYSLGEFKVTLLTFFATFHNVVGEPAVICSGMNRIMN